MPNANSRPHFWTDRFCYIQHAVWTTAGDLCSLPTPTPFSRPGEAGEGRRLLEQLIEVAPLSRSGLHLLRYMTGVCSLFEAGRRQSLQSLGRPRFASRRGGLGRPSAKRLANLTATHAGSNIQRSLSRDRTREADAS